jgi:hypothetical protein
MTSVTVPREPAGSRGSDRPLYRGEPLDAERGPGLGCFWTQAILLAVVLVLIPIGVWNEWSIYVTGGLLVLALVLVFFTSLTVIFLLRLVAADRRARRRPLSPTARPTVGDLEAGEETTTPPLEDASGEEGMRQ